MIYLLYVKLNHREKNHSSLWLNRPQNLNYECIRSTLVNTGHSLEGSTLFLLLTWRLWRVIVELTLYVYMFYSFRLSFKILDALTILIDDQVTWANCIVTVCPSRRKCRHIVVMTDIYIGYLLFELSVMLHCSEYGIEV